MRSTVNELEQLPEVTPEDAVKLEQVVLHLATELEVKKAEPLPLTADREDS
jgi:hypothetical protein